MISLLKTVYPEYFFEFGTYLGIQLLNLAANTNQTKFYTMDLDLHSFRNIKQAPKDLELSILHFKMEKQLAFSNTQYSDRIIQLFGNSVEYDFSEFFGKIDMIYIDGGHDYLTVQSDTENAFKMLNEKKLSAILWHDYNNPNQPDVQKFINKLGKEKDIFFIEESWIAFYLNDPKDILKSQLCYNC